MQFAVGRNETNPKLSVRRKENNVMARQLLLTLALEKMGKPATTANGDMVVQSWLKKNGRNNKEYSRAGRKN